ncbi:hypothetical protein [Sagittula sp. S175]|uniref:hypothetical protein n=1 Tax=Sagittula sp. S175 TaxID=3415129 RepID=UPI003C7B994D
MSFYFTIATDRAVEPEDVLAELGRPEVRFHQPGPEMTVFYIPGESLRGVVVGLAPPSVSVGINAFTPMADAALGRQIAAAIGRFLGVAVEPEDSETALPPEDIAQYGGDAWLAARLAEATMVLGPLSRMAEGDTMRIEGYLYPFSITKDMFDTEHDKRDQSVQDVMQKNVALQAYAEREDIFVPSVMTVTPKTAPKRSWLDRLTGKPAVPVQPFDIFFLGVGVHCLTPLLGTGKPGYVGLRDAQKVLWRLPIASFGEFAQQAALPMHGPGIWEITLDEAENATLMRRAERM